MRSYMYQICSANRLLFDMIKLHVTDPHPQKNFYFTNIGIAKLSQSQPANHQLGAEIALISSNTPITHQPTHPDADRSKLKLIM